MKEKAFEGKTGIGGENNNHLIQAAVICLAGVSLFTTAQGMTKYIFRNNVISYASSAAIQGILLAMSMRLPSYVQGVFKNQWKRIFKYLVSGAIIIFQIKEKRESKSTKWLQKKVYKDAVGQIKDTIKMIKSENIIEVESYTGERSYKIVKLLIMKIKSLE